jgi:DNA-binding transcriptional LysR family regulator
MPLLTALRERYPGAQVALTTGNSERMLADLDGYRVDVAVTAVPDLDRRRFATLPLWRNAVVAYVGYRHPLAGHTEVRLEHLRRHPLVLREPGSITRSVFEQALARAGAELAGWPEVIQVDSREAVHAAVTAGLGVGVVSERELPHDPRVAVLDLADMPLAITEYLACLAANRRSRLVRAVFELAATITADRTPGSDPDDRTGPYGSDGAVPSP